MLRKGDGLTKTERLLCDLVDDCDAEDRSARERQMLLCKKLKLFWDNFQQVWYSEVAHDWRVNIPIEDTDQAAYDKPVNIFRAYLESIIAALSVTVPPLECYPDDADNELDLTTARAGNKISQILYRQNNVQLLWVHALFIWATEGMVGCYSHNKTSKEYGTYKEEKFRVRQEGLETATCPNCGYQFNEAPPAREEVMEGDIPLPAEPGLEQPGIEEMCPSCGEIVVPETNLEINEIAELFAVEEKAKSRICLEAYGGLYLKIPMSAKKQEDIIYVIFDREIHYGKARAEYPNIREKITPGTAGTDAYYRQMRENNQYVFGEADNNVTKRKIWLRPEAFETLNKEDRDHLIKKFPKGVEICIINDELAEYNEAELDKCWTFTRNPLSDYVQHDPMGLLLVSVQEITNDLISLIMQTVEHGIPQTMADPTVLDFKKYRQTEAGPGMIFPAVPKSGRSMGDAFYEVKTATLSAEIFPFGQMMQSLGQQVSGALPSLFGGEMEGNKTASGYSMSRSQALQRLQNTWKMLTTWWKEIFAKVIPMYIENVQEDEKFVQRESTGGGFVNILIRKAELEGRIGSVELEANENLPLTWLQRKDIIIQLMSTNNPQFLEALAAPENLPIMQEAVGLADFYMPGEDDRIKQYDEIKLLLESEPIPQPPDEMMMAQAEINGMEPPQPTELPSIEAEQIDDHVIQFEICRRWMVSAAGRLAKTENEEGYRNVLLHALQHKTLISPPPMPGGPGGNPEKPNPLETQEAPITGEPNAATA